MKKIIAAIMCLSIFLALCGCTSPMTATVVIDGTKQTVTDRDICRYPAKYRSKEITVTGKILAIDGPIYNNTSVPYYYEYKLNLGAWHVYIAEDAPIFSELNIDDNITVTAKIKDAYISVDICGWDDSYDGRGWDSHLTKITKN